MLVVLTWVFVLLKRWFVAIFIQICILLSIGAKNDSLYITSSNSNSFSFNGTHSLSKHFDFSFDDDEDVMIINGKKFDFKELKDKMNNIVHTKNHN